MWNYHSGQPDYDFSHMFYVVLWYWFLMFCVNCVKDIDQLKKTMQLTGTPGPPLLAKITSDEVVAELASGRHVQPLFGENTLCLFILCVN